MSEASSAPTVPHITHTCGTPFVKQLTNGAHGLKDTVGSHEEKTLSGQQISFKCSSTPEECQNVLIVEVVSLILLEKLTMKHNRQLVQ